MLKWVWLIFFNFKVLLSFKLAFFEIYIYIYIFVFLLKSNSNGKICDRFFPKNLIQMIKICDRFTGYHKFESNNKILFYIYIYI